MEVPWLVLCFSMNTTDHKQTQNSAHILRKARPGKLVPWVTTQRGGFLHDGQCFAITQQLQTGKAVQGLLSCLRSGSQEPKEPRALLFLHLVHYYFCRVLAMGYQPFTETAYGFVPTTMLFVTTKTQNIFKKKLGLK